MTKPTGTEAETPGAATATPPGTEAETEANETVKLPDGSEVPL